MSNDPRIDEIQRRLLRPGSVEDVRAMLPVLDELSTSNPMSGEWLRRAFQTLRELTAANPEQSVEILTGDLLPRCLVPDARNDNGYGHRHCYTFGEWLDELPQVQRHRVRAVALPRAIASLGGDAVRNAIRLISCIGYWDEGILDALDRVARGRDDETGDHALSARISLRSDLEPAVRTYYLGKLHKRIPSGPNLHQLASGRIIGTSDTAELVWAYWLAPLASGSPDQNLLASFARSLVVEIAARVSDAAFTFKVWNWLVELSRRSKEGIDDVFGPNSSLVNHLDLPVVIPELVGLASHAQGSRRYIYYLRVLECERPAHMAGWNTVATADLEVVRADAVGPTKMTGKFATIELHQKEAAWDVLLCRGDASVLPLLGDALAEESGHVCHQFLELAACFQLNPLPRSVTDLIAGSRDGMTWDEHERLVAQIGAIGAAHGAGTSEAFDALLGYRQVRDGVLLSLVEALGETALTLLESGDRLAVERLFRVAESSLREDSRGAAAGAVAALLTEGVLTEPETARAAALLLLPTTDRYARRELLFALATRPLEKIPTIVFEYANSVLDSAETENQDIRPAALVLLARQPESRLNPTFLWRHIGLTDQSGIPRNGPGSFNSVAPHVLGRFFAAEPERFGAVAASLLKDGDTNAIANILPSIRETGRNNPKVVLDALVTRLRGADNGRIAQPFVLQSLAAVAPDRLLIDGCPNVAAWLPQLRVELADTLGGIDSLPSALAHARFELLAQLAGDGIYAVRRAAYRAAAACEQDRFAALAVSWAEWREPGGQGPRRYAAESAGWFSPRVAGEKLAQLGWDQEPAVREAFKRSLDERNDRLAASEFVERVLDVREPADVVRNWRHGVGLSRVGDDSTIRRLATRLGDGLAPSIRFWLKRVRKAVEKRWGEVTRKWPEPWYARPGHLELFSGILKDNDGTEAMLAGTLWLIPGESPGELSSWGGWATSEMPWTGDKGVLHIPNRSNAKLLLSSMLFPTCELVFWGNGAYPKPLSH